MPFHFDGFSSPRYTQVPDELFDQLLAVLTGAELKVLLYIVRRTFGFKKDCDPISLNQFMTGIRTRAGAMLDHGCGIADRSTVTKALAHLEEMGIITSEKYQGQDGVHVTTVYALRFLEPAVGVVGFSDYSEPGVVGKSDHPRSGETRPRVVGKSDLQKTVEQDDSPSQHTARHSMDSNASVSPKTRVKNPSPYPYLAAVMEDISEQLGENQLRRVNLRRAQSLMERQEVPEEEMAQLCRQAYDAAREFAATTNRPGAYFFQVVEQRLARYTELHKPQSLAGKYAHLVKR